MRPPVVYSEKEAEKTASAPKRGGLGSKKTNDLLLKGEVKGWGLHSSWAWGISGRRGASEKWPAMALGKEGKQGRLLWQEPFKKRVPVSTKGEELSPGASHVGKKTKEAKTILS